MVQEEIERVVTLGRLEAPRAEQMAVQAFDGTVAALMDHLAHSDALRGMVADASAGLAKTAVDEVRHGAVGADDRAEALVRRILRRSPRSDPSVATE